MPIGRQRIDEACLPHQITAKRTRQSLAAGGLFDNGTPGQQVVCNDIRQTEFIIDGKMILRRVAEHARQAAPPRRLRGNLDRFNPCLLAILMGQPVAEVGERRRAVIGNVSKLCPPVDPLLAAARVEHVAEHALSVGSVLHVFDQSVEHVSGIRNPLLRGHRCLTRIAPLGAEFSRHIWRMCIAGYFVWISLRPPQRCAEHVESAQEPDIFDLAVD